MIMDISKQDTLIRLLYSRRNYKLPRRLDYIQRRLLSHLRQKKKAEINYRDRIKWIASLQQLASASMLPTRSDHLNMSGTSSLDDRGSLTLGDSHSHWDEPTEAEIQQSVVHGTRRYDNRLTTVTLSLRCRTPSSELLGSSHSRRSIRNRRSDRFMVDSGSPLDSGSGGEQQQQQQQQRMGGGMNRDGPIRVDPMGGAPPQRRHRSRSQGRPIQRTSYLNQAPPMYMDYPQQHMYEFARYVILLFKML